MSYSDDQDDAEKIDFTCNPYDEKEDPDAWEEEED
jgi:hypothetical protein